MADRYRVHGAQETTVPVPAKTAEGVEIMGALPVVIVEMVGVLPHQRSFTHVELVNSDELLAAARAKFRVDVVLELSIAVVEEGDKA